MIPSIHPFVLVAAVSFLVALVLLGLYSREASLASRVGLILAALLCLLPAGWLLTALRPEWVDGRFRTYKTFYRELQEGMTRQEVDALLARNYPASGRRQPPKILGDTAEFLGFFMNPETSREPNCEGIFLTWRDGRIAKKVYSPD